jgi:glycosyltransferase involved in cell wall biosynthesis
MAASLRGTRIARVSTVPYFVVTQLRVQIESLARAEAEVVVITSSGPELRRLAAENVSVETIEIPRSIRPFKDLVALFKLFICFRHYRFDIVHSTTPKAGLLCAVAGVLAGVPVRLHTFTGQPWVGLAGPVRWLSRWADWVIGKFNTRCYADSESQRDFLVAEGVVSAANIGVIGKGSLAGVDLRRFDSARWPEVERTALLRELGISRSETIILFVGRVTRDKGIGELLEAFDILVQEGHAIALLLIGPMDTELGGATGFGAKKITKLPRVRYVGYTDCPERYMAISDILCLPSYREGFGTVVIEAAAMGVPTVGTNIYGLSDAVVDDETGLLVPPRNVRELASALRRLLVDDKMRNDMGESAKKRASALFDAAKVNKLVVDEYCTLLKGKIY